MEESEQVTRDREQSNPEEQAEAREETTAGAGVDDMAGAELDGVRDLIVKAYPDIVPELLSGESVDALLASVPAAREAYAQVATAIQEQRPTPTPIPTGSGRRPPIDPDGLSPEAKIRAGLRQVGL